MKNLITFSTLLIVTLLLAGSSAFAQNENASGSTKRGRIVTKAIIVVDSNGDAIISTDGGKNWRGIEPVTGRNDQSECPRESTSGEQQPTPTYTEAFELAPSKPCIAVSSPSHAA